MLLHALGISTTTTVALIAIFGYSPLPSGLDDRYRAMLSNGYFKLTQVLPYSITESMGFGSYFDYLPTLQRMERPDLKSPPVSASYGDLNVTRAGIAGRPVIVYSPKDLANGELVPALIYIHGGGFVRHSPDFYDKTVHEIANCSRKITISVDYRLSPKHPFPGPVQDCLGVARHVLKHGATLNIDVGRVGIAGDDTGGNMAAAIALRLVSEKASGSNLPSLQYQALLWPALQVLNFRLPSYLEMGDSIPVLSAHRMAGFWAMYLGLDPLKTDTYAKALLQNKHVSHQILKNSKYSEYIDVQNLPPRFRTPRPEVMTTPPLPLPDNPRHQKPKKNNKDKSVKSQKSNPTTEQLTDLQLFNKIKHKLTNPLLAPLLSPDVRGLPPTLVVVSEFDVLRDDGLLYAHRLQSSGITTEVYIGKGYHCDFLKTFPDLQSYTGAMSRNALFAFIRKHT